VCCHYDECLPIFFCGGGAGSGSGSGCTPAPGHGRGGTTALRWMNESQKSSHVGLFGSFMFT